MVVEALSGSMAAGILGRGGETAHGALVLGVMHELAAGRLLAPRRAAQRADERVVAVDMHALARQRRAAAVDAGVAVPRQGAQALAQEVELQEVGTHALGVRRRRPGSLPCPSLDPLCVRVPAVSA